MSVDIELNFIDNIMMQNAVNRRVGNVNSSGRDSCTDADGSTRFHFSSLITNFVFCMQINRYIHLIATVYYQFCLYTVTQSIFPRNNVDGEGGLERCHNVHGHGTNLLTLKIGVGHSNMYCYTLAFEL
jgi:hypothetical protein